MAEVEEPSPTGPGRSAGSGLRSILVVAVGLAILLTAYLLGRSRPLTILVVSFDTTRADHLTPYGYGRPTTPLLDRLASEGTLFTHARSTTSWTLPSHMSLFTGLPPALHGVLADFHVLDQNRPILGEIFRDAGFRTMGVYSAPYVHPQFGFGRGMDFYEQATQYPMAYDLSPAQQAAQLGLREVLSHEEVTGLRVAGQARRLLKQSARDRTLMFLHFFDPHYDYHAPARLVRTFADPDYRGPVDGTAVLGSPEIIHPGMPAADLQHLKDLYDAELRFTDENLGTVLDVLEKEGRIGSTLVVVVADHGEEFFDHGRIGHRMTLKEEVLHVPLILWGPGLIPAGRVVDDDVALYDVLPTLMDYAGLDPDPRIYGRSLRPLIEGGELPARPTSASLTFLYREAPDYYTRHDAVVFGGLKYIRSLDVPWSRADPARLDNPPDLDSETDQVYDLREDPGEQHDLVTEAPGDPRITQARAAFDAELSRQEQAREREFRGTGGQTRDIGWEQMQDELRALGYVQGVADQRPATPAGGTPPADR